MTTDDAIDEAVERMAQQRFHIGSWVRRGRQTNAKGHLVETIVAGDAITRCGKRMRDGKVGRRGVLEVHEGAVSRAGRPLDWGLCQGGCTAFGFD